MSATGAMPAALALYGAGLAAAHSDPGRRPLHAVDDDGTAVRLPLERWLGDPPPEERALLDRVRGPVLDLGCGPGRHVLGLRARGVDALGIDVSDIAAGLARARGAPVVHGSLFGPVPRTGRWRAALLLDGNMGIGGDPHRLLARVAELVAPGGELWLELDPSGGGSRQVRLRIAGRLSDPFPWTRVGAADLGALVAGGDWRVAERWDAARRCFARLERTCPT